MIKIQFGMTTGQIERLLLDLIAEWDELARWAVKNTVSTDKVQIAREEKDKLLAKLTELRAMDKAG